MGSNPRYSPDPLKKLGVDTSERYKDQPRYSVQPHPTIGGQFPYDNKSGQFFGPKYDRARVAKNKELAKAGKLDTKRFDPKTGKPWAHGMNQPKPSEHTPHGASSGGSGGGGLMGNQQRDPETGQYM